MITAWIFVAIALLALTALLYAAVARSHPASIEDAIQAMRAIDIAAFRNLMDPNEEEFLRAHLPPDKFREIKRERARAAIAYVWSAGQAAALFADVGQSAKHSPDPTIAASGAQIAQTALRLRLQTMQTCFRLAETAMLPGRKSLATPGWVDQFEWTAEALQRLGRLRRHESAYSSPQ